MNAPEIARLTSALPPGGADGLLLHSCCAPCSCGIMTRLRDAEIPFQVFFCNPNIFPDAEYEKRKNENKRFADALGAPFLDADRDHALWLTAMAGHENAPERGRRCDLCFEYRLRAAACAAVNAGFSVFATSLALSRWKDLEQVNAAGRRAAKTVHPIAMTYWDFNWRKMGGSALSDQIARRELFYRQTYCGCEFSRRDAGSL